MTKKNRIQAYVDRELISWVDNRVEDKTFSSRSHAISLALELLREKFKGGWRAFYHAIKTATRST